MDFLEINNIKSEEKSNTTDHLIIILSEVLPEFNDYINNKANILKKRVIFYTVSGIVLFLGIIISIFTHYSVFLILLIFSIVFLTFGIRYNVRAKKMQFKSTITGIGKSQIDLALYPFEEGSFLIDKDKIMGTVEMSFPTLENFSKCLDLISEYKEIMSKLPYIIDSDSVTERTISVEVKISEFNFFEIETQLHKILNGLIEYYDNSETYILEMGIIEAKNPLINFLLDNKFTDLKKFESSNKVQEQLEKMLGIIKEHKKTKNNLKFKNKEIFDIDDISEEILQEINDSSSKFYKIRINTLKSILGLKFSRINDLMHYNAYSFYCPYCNQDTIDEIINRDYSVIATGEKYEPISMDQNTKVYISNWEEGIWKCNFCNKETRNPIPVHKLYEQVFLPASNLLLLENEKDRIKIYLEFREKILSYKQKYEKEFREINRVINSEIGVETFKLKKFQSEVSCNEKIINQMEQLMIELDVLLQKDLERINRYLSEVRENLNKRHQENINEAWNFYNNLRTRTSTEMENLAKNAERVEAFRDAVMLATFKSINDISKNTSQIAQSSAMTAKNTTNISKYTRSLSELDLVRGRKEGLDKHPLNPLGYL